jgi:hypothetical protein
MLRIIPSPVLKTMKESVMSIWSDLLSLHGYVIPAHNDDTEPERARAARDAEADRLRELIGSRSPSTPRPEPRGPLLGVHGLS